MKVAALDLGSNTFLCLIAEVSEGKVVKVIDDQMKVVRLGQGLKKGSPFHPDAIDRAEKCLAAFSEIIKINSPDKVLAVATAAARNASNPEALVKLCEKYEIPIQIVTGDQEAQITYEGGLSGLDSDGHFILIDIGGGSTEVIYGSKGLKHIGKSFDFGVVKLTEAFINWHYPVSKDIVRQIEKEVRSKMAPWLKDLLGKPLDKVVSVAGTPTAIAAMEVGKFDVGRIDGYKMSKEKLEHWIMTLSRMTPEDIHQTYGLEPGRADVILSGVIILNEFLGIMGLSELEVSTRGVRFGVALGMARGDL